MRKTPVVAFSILLYREHGRLVPVIDGVSIIKRSGLTASTADDDGAIGGSAKKRAKAVRVREAVVRAVGKLKLRKVRGALR